MWYQTLRVTDHLLVKCKTGHDVVEYVNKEYDDDDACFCDSHPENKCSAYCKMCDVPICILCLSIKHKSHDVSELKRQNKGTLRMYYSKK